jgi:hypothetical protein
LKKDQILNKNIWKSLTGDKIRSNNVIISKNLTVDQSAEYDLLKKLSEQLIINNYDRNPTFNRITKTSIGYRINRVCPKKKTLCSWNININVNTNEAILSCSNKDCKHNNQRKLKSKFYRLPAD